MNSSTSDKATPPAADRYPTVTREVLERNQRIYVDIVAKYYGDPDFKADVDRDPNTTIRREGLEVPDGADIRVLFNTDKLIHVVLPAPVKG